ncbi:MAG: hypothetical protein ACYTGV_09740, partial [Planctomycetota bacterium]
MRFWRCVVLVALVGLVAGGARAAPDPDLVEAVVRRGVVWLRKEQKADGSFGSNPGETALALMA